MQSDVDTSHDTFIQVSKQDKTTYIVHIYLYFVNRLLVTYIVHIYLYFVNRLLVTITSCLMTTMTLILCFFIELRTFFLSTFTDENCMFNMIPII